MSPRLIHRFSPVSLTRVGDVDGLVRAFDAWGSPGFMVRRWRRAGLVKTKGSLGEWSMALGNVSLDEILSPAFLNLSNEVQLGLHIIFQYRSCRDGLCGSGLHRLGLPVVFGI